MSDEQSKNSEQKVPKKNIDPHSMQVPHLDTLDQGTEAFMQWLNSEDKQSVNNPIILKEFVNNKHTVLYDNTLGHDVIIETQNGVPRCKNCDSDDCGHVALFVNSFFESASGFTTTGLSMITQPENLPQSFDLCRSYTQWVGGLSFVYLVVMLFYPERKLVHMRGMIGGGILRSKQLIITISIIFTIYTTVLSALLYLLGNINNLNSLSIVFSTITGGGFVPTSTFLSDENAIEMLIIMVGMIISALPFAFHYAVFSKEVKTTQLRPEVFVYLALFSLLFSRSNIVIYYKNHCFYSL